MLTEKVALHEINAIIKIAHKALTLLQITKLNPFKAFRQLPLSSAKAAKASAKLADSKMMKKTSSKTSLIFVFAERRPNGFPVYSSQVT
jgi:hypothetical protein